MNRIKAKGMEVIVYEPTLHETTVFSSRVVNDLVQFKADSGVIVANRKTVDLGDVAGKVYFYHLFEQESAKA